MKVTDSLIDHFERAVGMFRSATRNFPETEWTIGEIDYLRPAGVAYHVVETIEFYISDVSADSFAWGSRFGCDWEEPDSSKLPSQEQVLSYLDDTWYICKNRIVDKTPEQIETIYPWTGATFHSRLLYLLRHIQHHTAEMSLELKRRGYNCPDWK